MKTQMVVVVGSEPQELTRFREGLIKTIKIALEERTRCEEVEVPYRAEREFCQSLRPPRRYEREFTHLLENQQNHIAKDLEDYLGVFHRTFTLLDSSTSSSGIFGELQLYQGLSEMLTRVQGCSEKIRERNRELQREISSIIELVRGYPGEELDKVIDFFAGLRNYDHRVIESRDHLLNLYSRQSEIPKEVRIRNETNAGKELIETLNQRITCTSLPRLCAKISEIDRIYLYECEVRETPWRDPHRARAFYGK